MLRLMLRSRNPGSGQIDPHPPLVGGLTSSRMERKLVSYRMSARI